MGLFLYQLHTSGYILERPRIPPIICEVVAPRKGLVRELSVESFDTNSNLSMESLNGIFGKIETLDEWNLPGSPMDVLTRRKAILKREFRWEEDTVPPTRTTCGLTSRIRPARDTGSILGRFTALTAVVSALFHGVVPIAFVTLQLTPS